MCVINREASFLVFICVDAENEISRKNQRIKKVGLPWGMPFLHKR